MFGGVVVMVLRKLLPECAHSSLELQWHLRGHTCSYSWQRQWADFDKYIRD